MSKDKHTKKSKYGQLFEFTLIAVAVVVLVLIVSYTIKINSGIAKEVGSPLYHLRVEILNAGAENGLEKQLKEYLQDLEIPDTELNIVKVSRFTQQPSKETFIISRKKESEGINQICKLLGIDKEKIEYSKLAQNKDDLHATIVIGTDSIIEDLLDKSKELE